MTKGILIMKQNSKMIEVEMCKIWFTLLLWCRVDTEALKHPKPLFIWKKSTINIVKYRILISMSISHT
jgi:hypothetical protein